MSEVEIAAEGAEAAPAVSEQTPDPAPQQQESATAEPQDDPPRDSSGRFVKRINELTREKYEARRAAEQLQRERDEALAELQRFRQPAPDPNADPAGYLQHLAREEARQLIESERKRDRESQEQARFQSLAEQSQAREQAYAAQHPDYEEALQQFVEVVGPNPTLGEVLMTSEHGPQLVHYLGRNLDEAAHIASLPPHLAARALGVLEARVSAPRTVQTTKAPSPPPVLAGSAVTSKDPAKMSYADYKKWRQGS